MPIGRTDVNRRLRYALGVLLVNAAALSAVLLAVAQGGSWRRWGPTAAFLSIGTAAALCAEAIHHLKRRRARRQEAADVPRGVRLRKPRWLSLDEPLAFVDHGAPLAGVPAALGFAGVGVGILLTVCALMVLHGLLDVFMSFSDVSLETDGLRVYLRSASFVVPWKSIAAVAPERPTQRKLTNLELVERASAVASVQPDTPRNRRRVYLATYDGDHRGGRLTLLGWTGGLDAPVLARAIRAAIGQPPARAN